MKIDAKLAEAQRNIFQVNQQISDAPADLVITRTASNNIPYEVYLVTCNNR